MTGTIFSVQRFSLYDGPGIRTTVFLKGCPLRCLWCHNPESQRPEPEILRPPSLCVQCGRCEAVCPGPPCRHCLACADVCPTGAKERCGRLWTVEEALHAALEDKIFYRGDGGVTLSGGEPLLQADFAAALLSCLKKEGISTAVDTCGFVPREAFSAVLPHADLFLYDLKAWDGARHRALTGADNGRILENYEGLLSAGARVFVRIPVIPGINEDQLPLLAEYLRKNPPKRVELMAYHDTARDKYAALGRDYPLPEVQTPEQAAIDSWIQIFRERGVDAHCSARKEEV